VKDENGDLLADANNILNRWNDYFSQLFNAHMVSDVRQIEMLVNTTEQLVVKVKIAIAKSNKLQSSR
jgi:hypothetical protein